MKNEKQKPKLTAEEKYKRAYNIFMDYFDLFTIEEKIEIDAQLNEIGL